MNLGIILTFYYQVSFWWKEKKDKFIAKFMATRSLLDYFQYFALQ